MTLESEIEKDLVHWCRKNGILCLKQNPAWYVNIPDRLIVLPNSGRCFFLELKRPGVKPRPGQTKRHRQMRRMGFEVYWCDNLQDALKIIEEKL